MELAFSRKLPKDAEAIATFDDNSKYIYYTESQENPLIKQLKALDGEEIKKMLITGKIARTDILDLLDYNDKSSDYLSEDRRTFTYTEKDVMVMPTQQKERELIYIHGVSGSGKSYWTKMYAKLYKKLNKGNEVFLLSHVDDDPSFSDLKYKHIPIDVDILDQVDLSTFENSLIIFDDTDCPKDKNLQKLVDSLKDDIAQRGRHHNISAIFTTHMACNFVRTRVLLSECDKFVIFPGSGGIKQQEYMVVNYGGMDKKFFATLKDFKSRWICFNVRYPNYIVYQNGVTLLG